MSKGKPRILRIVNRFNLGGPTYNASYLTKYLEDDFETMLIGGEKTLDEESSLFIAEKLGIQAGVISGMSRSVGFLNEFRAYNRIKSIIREFKPDIVHTHASKAGALGRVAARRARVPHVVHTFHGHVFEHYFGPMRSKMVIRTERRLAKYASAIVAISETQKRDLTERFKICSGKKVHVIPLGFELERFREDREEKRSVFRSEYEISDDEIAIGIIGRLAPVKNHELFIEAIAKLKSENLPVRGMIIGDGSERRRIEQLAKGKGLTKKDLVFTSWIKEIDRALPGLDIVALTSLNEGTPVSLIEAQAAGVPVVSSDVGGVRDIMINEKTGLLFPTGKSEILVEKLSQLINDREMRKEFGNEGQQFAFEKFTVRRLAEDMKKLYFELLKLN